MFMDLAGTMRDITLESCCIPDSHSAIIAASYEEDMIRRWQHPVDGTLMFGKCCDKLTLRFPWLFSRLNANATRFASLDGRDNRPKLDNITREVIYIHVVQHSLDTRVVPIVAVLRHLTACSISVLAVRSWQLFC